MDEMERIGEVIGRATGGFGVDPTSLSRDLARILFCFYLSMHRHIVHFVVNLVKF